MTNVTVITPCAPYHTDRLESCRSAVAAQTVPVKHIVVMDHDRRGPGWARNKGLAETKTPFVVFLDADDTIEPTFVEKCLAVIQPGAYVYTDWMQMAQYVHAPKKPWVDGTWHCVTTLLHTADARRVGGFPEDMALEDTHFYTRLLYSNVQPLHLPEALFSYSPFGQRAKTDHANGRAQASRAALIQRYANQLTVYGEVPKGMKPLGQRQEAMS